MNPLRYLMGSPVYRAASNAPTRGTVDPMGYINRSLASPVGGDGLSDRRSGLAQAALSRLRNSQNGHLGPAHMATLMPPPQPVQPQVSQTPVVPNNSGFTVTATGQLMPISATPIKQPVAPDPAQMMQAARDRLQHVITTKEMLTKHQINMQNMILRHGRTVQSGN